MVSSRRANRKLSAHELVRFLDLLSATGNFALACEKLGRSKSALYKRRIRDSLFDSECIAAIALSRLSSLERDEQGVGGSGGLTLTTYAGRPQLRRAAPGTRTRPSLETFLRTLAATGNVRFAAKSIGVAASSIHARRRRDPAFADEVRVALDIARASLEMNLIEASGAFADWHLAPSPLEGEGGGDGFNEDSAEPDPSGHFATRMTVSQAIRLVGRLEKSLAREAAGDPGE